MAVLTVIVAWFQVSHSVLHLLRAIWSPLLWGKQANAQTERGLVRFQSIWYEWRHLT